MRQIGDRVITVKKTELLSKIAENKAKHIEEYKAAVIAYKEEADKQLRALRKSLNEGKLDLDLELVTPINKEEEYDKLTTMFTWEVKGEVELSQAEFNQYIFDELPFSVQSKFANTYYTSRSKSK